MLRPESLVLFYEMNFLSKYGFEFELSEIISQNCKTKHRVQLRYKPETCLVFIIEITVFGFYLELCSLGLDLFGCNLIPRKASRVVFAFRVSLDFVSSLLEGWIELVSA